MRQSKTVTKEVLWISAVGRMCFARFGSEKIYSIVLLPERGVTIFESDNERKSM